MPRKSAPRTAISKKRATDKERRPVVRKVCQEYALDRYNVEECCKAAKISVPSFYRWVDESDEFLEMWFKAKQERMAVFTGRLRERALTALEQRVMGKKVTEARQEGYFETDESGNKKFIVTKTIQTIKEIQPSDTAIIFALVNTSPEQFQRTGMEKEGPAKPSVIKELEGLTEAQIMERLNQLELPQSSTTTINIDDAQTE